MAKTEGPESKGPEAKGSKKGSTRQTWSQMWQAFQLQRNRDGKLIPLMLLALLGPAVLLFLIGIPFGWEWWLGLLGLALGIPLAMFVFTRRLRTSMFDEVGNQPGAGAWVLEELAGRKIPGVFWSLETAVAANTHLDVVHRLVGNPGVILVAEGELHRTRPMMATAKKSLARIVGDAAIYEFFVGEAEGAIPVKRLQREITKLPRNLDKTGAEALSNRVESMDRLRTNAGLPGGPTPKGARVQGVNRRARRASERQGRRSK